MIVPLLFAAAVLRPEPVSRSEHRTPLAEPTQEVESHALNWPALAACESGGDPTTDTGNGFYGEYQFDLTTWESVGGHGLPSDASAAEQTCRATLLYRERGTAPWPVCGWRLAS